VLKVPYSNSFKRRRDQALDGVSDADAPASNQAVTEQSPVNFVGVASLFDSPQASPAVPGSMVPAAPGGAAATSTSFVAEAAPAVTVADGASAEIAGVSAQSVTFTGTTGTLKLDQSLTFTGEVSGLAGLDAIDLADVSYGIQTQVTFLGNTTGGTLTITDGLHTANITLEGNYLSSTWTLSSDGNGGTVVVDPTANTAWQTLKVGAGGFLSGISVSQDGTMVVRTDTYGAYIWNGTQWQQLVTAASMPAGFEQVGQAQGVYEIQIAPSNSNILYMMYDGYIFQSTNKGTTWTQTSFAPVTESPNTTVRGDGEHIAIDPNNPNVVYVGTPQNGLFVTTNGGATWQSVGAVPVSLTDSSGEYPGITGLVFDPAIGGTTGGKTNTIFASSYGNGVYESTNAGATWTALPGGPTDVENATVSSTGVYYAVGNNNSSLWSYANGKWTELISPSQINGQPISAAAVNPSNPLEIVLSSFGGYLDWSLDGGQTWSGFAPNIQLTATDIPWLASTAGYLGVGNLVFSPTVPNQLIASGGVGVWTTTFQPTPVTPTNQVYPTINWTSQSIGIEQLVANEVLVAPGGKPVVASWDRGFTYISNPNEFPSTYGPVDGSFVAGWSLDYASSSPNFLVGIADWWGTEESGYSTDGGQTWTPFASEIPGAGSSFIGGTIAASSPTDIVWAPSGGNQPYYTLNGGVTWNPVVLPGVSNWATFDSNYSFATRTVTADRVLANTF
jgi:BNR/Asp-box repeat